MTKLRELRPLLNSVLERNGLLAGTVTAYNYFRVLDSSLDSSLSEILHIHS